VVTKKKVKKPVVKAKPAKKVAAKKRVVPKKKPAAKKSPAKKKKAKKSITKKKELKEAIKTRAVSRLWIDRCSHIVALQNQPSQRRKRNGVNGRPLTYEDSETLWAMCCEYFQYVEDHPLWESKVAQYQGDPVTMIAPKMGAMTLAGLQIYVGICKDTWLTYQQRDGGFLEVCTLAEQIIYNQKFQGAAADLLNPSIIARDLGLKDKKEVSGDSDNPLALLITQLSGKTIGPKR